MILFLNKTDYPDAFALGGHGYIKLGDYSRALMEFSQAIENENDEPEHHRWAGFGHHELKQFDLALTYYSKAIDGDKSKAGEYYFSRGTVK